MQNPEIVTASEIADYVFCPLAFQRRINGTPSANQPQLDTGIAQHSRKATAERVAGGSIAVGWWIILAAIAGLIWFLS